MGFADAFKQAIRPMHAREDLASLPWIAIHTKALWVPLLITLASTVAIIATGGTDTITQFLFAYFIQTPAIGGVFIAGFLAPRASWLLGVDRRARVGGLLLAPRRGRSRRPIYARGAADARSRRATSRSRRFIFSPIIGVRSSPPAAAWYRRFLALSSPNRGRRQSQARSSGRATAGRAAGRLAEGRRQALIGPDRLSRAGASRRGPAGERRPADPVLRPRRPPRGVPGWTGR